MSESADKISGLSGANGRLTRSNSRPVDGIGEGGVPRSHSTDTDGGRSSVTSEPRQVWQLSQLSSAGRGAVPRGSARLSPQQWQLPAGFESDSASAVLQRPPWTATTDQQRRATSRQNEENGHGPERATLPAEFFTFCEARVSIVARRLLAAPYQSLCGVLAKR